MPVVAEAVPGLLHVSLFLFFAGLGDFVMNINMTVGISTVVPIFVCGVFYIFTIFAPVLYPQSPYQNSFSYLVWYLIQKLGGRRYKDRGFYGASKSVSSNMAQGQLQLAMEETVGRMGRDVRAIRWLVDNMTEDTEMEAFVMAIPGSFNTQWGREVWKKASNTIGDEKSRSRDAPVGPLTNSNHVPIAIPPLVGRPSRRRIVRSALDKIIRLVRSQTRAVSDSRTRTMAPLPDPYLSPHSTIPANNQQDAVHALSTRIAHMLEICGNPNFSPGDELLRKRTCACIETTALLVCYSNAEFHWFGDMTKLLEKIGVAQETRQPFIKDQLAMTCWVCLSMVAGWRRIQEVPSLVDGAKLALKILERTGDHDTGDEKLNSLTRGPKVFETFDMAWRFLMELSAALYSPKEELTEGQIKEILRHRESQISELEQINIEDVSFQNVDEAIEEVRRTISRLTYGILVDYLPGVEPDYFDDTESVHFNELVELFCGTRSWQFIFPIQNIKRILSLATISRNILEGRKGFDTFQETLQNLEEFAATFKSFDNPCQNPLHRQMLRLQDLRDGGGLGFIVELLFIVVYRSSLDSSKEEKELQSSLYISTFRIITSDWSKYKQSLGTQQLLLDMLISVPGIIYPFRRYPTSLVNEFFVLLGNILEGQSGPHIDNVVKELSCNPLFTTRHRQALAIKALRAIAPARVPCSS